MSVSNSSTNPEISSGNKLDKNIMVVAKSRLLASHYFNGFVPNSYYRYHSIDQVEWVARDTVEQRFELKQIIPYVCLRHNRQLLTYRRTVKGSEQRLHNRISIGIGGHIKEEIDNKPGLTFLDIIRMAMIREFNEEVSIKWSEHGKHGRIRQVGYVNDDTDDVGLIHFGVVYCLDLITSEVESIELLEDELADVRWLDYLQLQQEAATSSLESWSRIIFPALLWGWNGGGI